MPRKMRKPAADTTVAPEHAQAAAAAVVADAQARPEVYDAAVAAATEEEREALADAYEEEARQLRPMTADELRQPDHAEPTVQDAASADRPDGDHTPAAETHDRPDHVHRHAHGGPKLQTRRIDVVGNATVRLIDDGNSLGIGIKLDYANPEERPSEAVKAILKEGRDNERGLGWNSVKKQWRKPVGPDPVHARLDVESRHADVVRQMREERGQDEGQGRG